MSLVPTVIEQSSRGERAFDIYSSQVTPPPWGHFYSIPNKNKSQCSLLKKTCSLTLNHTHKNARIIINTDTPGGCPTKGARHESRTAEY